MCRRPIANKGERLIEKPISWLFSKDLSGSLELTFNIILPVGRWSWKSKSAKECVTTHLPNELALKMDGAKANYRYQAIERTKIHDKFLFILVEVAIIQMRTLKTEVEKGFLSTVIGNRLIFLCQRILSNIKDGNIYINELLHLTLESIYLEKRFAETIQENYLVAYRQPHQVSKCFECQLDEIQSSAGKRRDETTAKGTGLAKSAGKEDPVELYSIFAFLPTLWRHSQVGSLTGAVHLLNNNADVQRQAQREQKSLRRSFLILRCRLFLSLGRRSLKVSDCSPANRERELGLDRRETVGSDNWYSNWLTNQCCEAKSVG
ncbi:hypothetical protein POVCU1_006720 [Plasmodium ovale curtisi]|uniref:Uncharacterized protein n=1 Tax=Plasmodium ovale curtisi TaxID=864141 RepID=A0A1A8VNS2_PLAOA|nr:hypothetical protein POVCU1_006720 [Plasmodium ovale curtisi]